MERQIVSHFFGCSGSSHRRSPESSNIKQLLMASQKVAFYCVIMLFRAVEILHVCLRTRERTMPCTWRWQRCRPVEFLRIRRFPDAGVRIGMTENRVFHGFCDFVIIKKEEDR